jgi:hypothetical protein
MIQGNTGPITNAPFDDTAGTRHQSADWHDSVTLNESWFYYITDHELMWILSNGTVPDRERIPVQSRKVILRIVRALTGLAVVTAFESACKFNAGYYVRKVQTPMCEFLHGFVSFTAFTSTFACHCDGTITAKPLHRFIGSHIGLNSLEDIRSAAFPRRDLSGKRLGKPNGKQTMKIRRHNSEVSASDAQENSDKQ